LANNLPYNTELYNTELGFVLECDSRTIKK